MVGGHSGGKSIELEQIGVISPFTHLHTQFPKELVEISDKTKMIKNLIESSTHIKDSTIQMFLVAPYLNIHTFLCRHTL